MEEALDLSFDRLLMIVILSWRGIVILTLMKTVPARTHCWLDTTFALHTVITLSQCVSADAVAEYVRQSLKALNILL